MRVPVQELTAGAFAPFGHVIEQPARSPDASGPGWQWWGETILMDGDDRPYGVGYLDLRPSDLQFDWAERHMRSVEVLLPSGSCLIYVAAPDHPAEPDQLPPLEQFQVFRVRQGQGVLLNKGVWHGAPLAIDGALTVVVLLLQHTGSTDTSMVRFPERVVISGE